MDEWSEAMDEWSEAMEIYNMQEGHLCFVDISVYLTLLPKTVYTDTSIAKWHTHIYVFTYVHT